MQYPRSTPRLPSAQVRGKNYGLANQLKYEASQSLQRNTMKKRLADEHAETRKAGAKRAARSAASSSGMNAGTLGGAYLSSMSRKSR
jgi:hypothetical protein